MKNFTITLAVAILTMVSVAKAATPAKVYSHLPLEIRETLTEELSNPDYRFDENMYGNVWIEFHLDGNRDIHITGLSADNLTLGTFVTEVLKELPQMSENCPIGKTYYVKVRLGYTK